jgi:uncharacterized oxidoreductase
MGGTINNMFAVLFDPARFAGVDWFRREVDGFVDYVKASPPADAGVPVLVPGEPERLARAERGRTGIDVDATTWEDILQAAEKVGLGRAEAEALVTGGAPPATSPGAAPRSYTRPARGDGDD